MSDTTQDNNQVQPDPATDNAVKDTKDWVTGDEPATGAQISYAKTMADQADEALPDTMTKAEASDKIEDLQDKTNRS